MIKIRQINKNKWISKTKKYDKKMIRNIRWEEEYGKGEKNEDSGERGEDEKRGKKMPFKSWRNNRRKKRKIRRKEKIQSGIACGLMITKKKKSTKTNPLGDVQNKTPKKKIKKNCSFNTKPPRRNIYISLTSRNLWKKSLPFQHLRPSIFLK